MSILGLSKTALSNIYTMSIAAELDPRQRVPSVYTVPDLDVRMLRAKLLMEETLETIQAMGLYVMPNAIGNLQGHGYRMVEDHPHEEKYPDLPAIIDGCCDVIYVAVGTLMSCGAADEVHMNVVNKANNAKFPGGKATFREDGKFLKPPGWSSPDHQSILDGGPMLDLEAVAKFLRSGYKENADV